MKTVIAHAVIIAASLLATGAHAQATLAPVQRAPTLPITPQPMTPTLGVAQSTFTAAFAGVSFPVLSMSGGATQSSAVAGTTAGTGRVTLAPVTLTKAIDASSAALEKAAAAGRKGTLTVTESKGGKAVKWVYSNAILASFNIGGGAPNAPQETLTFAYESVQMTY